ncbi:TrbG/VirB9 family P-type conjugative transfer protein [Bdellovibrionota bacterium FG-1]
MKRALVFGVLLIVCHQTLASEGRVRHVSVGGDQIVIVHTAIGIATIIQVPDTPSSVVVGDQEGFRVEYLDRAITIKPLRAGAKSNLYVYTDFKRYNIQLATGNEAAADYVVYLESPKPPARDAEHSTNGATIWTKLNKRLRLDDLRLAATRLGRAPSGVLLIEFEVSASRPDSFDPSWLWLIQEGKARPIQNLFLSSVRMEPGQAIRGVLQILRRDIDSALPLRIELRREKTAVCTLPKVDLWK